MTPGNAITIRPALRRDAADLAIIDNMASHGMSMQFWEHAASEGEGEDALVIARRRISDPEAVFGWQNAIVAESEDVIVGSVTAYGMPQPDDEIDWIKRTFPAFTPVFILFERAVSDWFVDSVGVFPGHRGKGIAGKLVDICLKKGRDNGFPQAALVVESNNEPALRLYEKRGFSTVDRLPIVTGNGETAPNHEWYLMKAAL